MGNALDVNRRDNDAPKHGTRQGNCDQMKQCAGAGDIEFRPLSDRHVFQRHHKLPQGHPPQKWVSSCLAGLLARGYRVFVRAFPGNPSDPNCTPYHTQLRVQPRTYPLMGTAHRVPY